MDRALNRNAKSPWLHQALAVAANRREGETLCVFPLASAVSMPDCRKSLVVEAGNPLRGSSLYFCISLL